MDAAQSSTRTGGRRRRGLSMVAVGLAVLVLAFLLRAEARADDPAPLVVAAAPELIDSGLMDWLAPRFRFKTRIPIAVEAAPTDGSALAEADVAIVAVEALDGDGGSAAAPTPITRRGAILFVALTLDGSSDAARQNVDVFVDWLVSDRGQRAIERFAPADGIAFVSPEGGAIVASAAPVAVAEKRGEALALQHCGRCHVINESNKYGGIGSTPSFAALRTIPDWRGRFDSFWMLKPHPSFTQVEGVTEPFSPDRPPHIAPIALTLDEAEAITAYAETIQPKDLGAPIQAQ